MHRDPWLHSVRMGGRGMEETASRILVTDPRAIRALANRDRLRLFTHLVTEGPATATQCAVWTGLDAKACSYHLRHLSKYGFVAQDPAGDGDRRIRRWRPLAYEFTLDVKDKPTVPQRRAVEALMRCLVEAATAQAEHWLNGAAKEPVEWLQAAQVSQRVLRLTAKELDQLNESITELMLPYLHRTRSDNVDARLVDAAIFLTPRGES
jgi:predicted transcriptional regulator